MFETPPVTHLEQQPCKPSPQTASSLESSGLFGSSNPGNRSSMTQDQTTPGGREIGGHQRMTNEVSLSGTTELSRSLSSSSSSFSSELPIVGVTDPSANSTTTSVTCRSVRKRPRISDLQKHASTSRIPNERHPARSLNPLRTPPPKRRFATANAAVRAHSRFTSPDRFVPKRPAFGQDSPSFRTSKPPSVLTGRELYTRSRDYTLNLFRSVSDRSSQTALRRAGTNIYGLRFPHYTPSFINRTDASPFSDDTRRGAEATRQLSWGGFWTIGGRGGTQLSQLHAVSDGLSGMLASGTNAPIHTPPFLDEHTRENIVQAHESRLALAMNVDPATRILSFTPPSIASTRTSQFYKPGLNWRDNAWTKDRTPPSPSPASTRSGPSEKTIPTVAFRVLDAPHLKDDYYCTILAYSYTSRILAVALTHKVYLWTEEYGVRYPPLPPSRTSNFVTSLAFSSDEGRKSILAVARHSGTVVLWSLLEPRPRFEAPHPCPASCVAFRPTVVGRQGANSDSVAQCEDLLVGDDSGRIYYYSLEWPSVEAGSMSLLIKLDAHGQNICGLTWAPDGEKFVSGGNDNIALLFHAEKVLSRPVASTDHPVESAEGQMGGTPTASVSRNAPVSGYLTPPASPERAYITGVHPIMDIFELPARAGSRNDLPESPPASPPRVATSPGLQQATSATRLQTDNPTNRRRTSASVLNNDLANPGIVGEKNMHAFSFYHSAAVKAMAFAPWQASLLATGGGSNDRQIHFHHTASGATLAVINVFAQVTSLIWSSTRREIAATFGYAQPEHEIRIAVFSWPSCECVVSIPWDRKLNGEIGRALWAIPYPGSPNDAVPTRRQSNEGFAAEEAVRLREARRRRGEQTAAGEGDASDAAPQQNRGRSLTRNSRSPASVRRRLLERDRERSRTGSRQRLRGEGETWASRTEEEGSLIIACCDQTVKFFEVWAGKRGRGMGLGSKEGVLGGSRVLEGWCADVGVEEVGVGKEDVIR